MSADWWDTDAERNAAIERERRALSEEAREMLAEAQGLRDGRPASALQKAEGLTRTERKLRERERQERAQAVYVASQVRRIAQQAARRLPPGSVVQRVVKGIQFRLMIDTEGRAHLLRPGTRPTLAELDAREGRGAVKL